MSLFSKILPNRNDKNINKLKKQIAEINKEYQKLKDLSYPELIDLKNQLKEIYQKEKDNSDPFKNILPKAIAIVKEVIRREKGVELYDVQLMGGISLHQGRVAEMKTGEGKTYVAPVAAFLNSLTGKSIHIVTVNNYLANRDADLMREIFKPIEITVGSISTQDHEQKKQAYQCDFVYGTTSDFGFDYLRDNLVYDMSEKIQSEKYFVIIDEVDSVLIDEARTPLIISGNPEKNEEYLKILTTIPDMLEKGNIIEKEDILSKVKEEVGDYTLDFKSRNVEITSQGFEKLEYIVKDLGLIPEEDNLFNSHNGHLINGIQNALNAAYIYLKDVNYVLKENSKGKLEVMIIDDNTGRIMEGRRWQGGLHQAIEAKEGVEIQEESKTVASITIQNYFRMYKKMSGMTGTADTEAFELHQVYGMETVVIPTNRKIQRIDNLDLMFLTKKGKEDRIIKMVKQSHEKGMPVLLGTSSVAENEYYSELLTKEGLPHNVLNAKEHAKEAEIIAQAGKKGAITISTNMAGRGTDIILGGNRHKEIEDILHSEIYNEQEKSEMITAIQAQQKADYEEVLKLGGLHVISTSRNDARRIDNQLRGRAGRQGDPGLSDFILSFEDELFMKTGIHNAVTMARRLGIKDDQEIQLKQLTKMFDKAQSKVESMHYESRKNLVKFDEILNEQRHTVYELRDSLLVEESTIERVLERILPDYIQNMIYRYMPEGSFEEQWDFEGLKRQLLNMDIDLSDKWKEQDGDIQEKIIDMIINALNTRVEKDIEYTTKEKFNQFLRIRCLQALDERWIQLIENLDNLRRGIHLHSYAQKDPRMEFKKAAFKMFGEFIEEIQTDFVLSLIENCRSIEIFQQEQVRKKERESIVDAINTIINSVPKGQIYLNGLVSAPLVFNLPEEPFNDNEIILNGVAYVEIKDNRLERMRECLSIN